MIPQDLLWGCVCVSLRRMLLVGWLWSALQPVCAPQQAASLRQGLPQSPNPSAVTVC